MALKKGLTAIILAFACVFSYAQQLDSIQIAQIDSLMGEWYLKMSTPAVDVYQMDSVRFTSNVPDSVLIQRLEKMNSYITLPFNETVKSYMVLYSEKLGTKMTQMLTLSDYYFPIFEEVFDRYGMPLELKYMSVIESALNPVARSRAGALGIWQFMYQTGKLYGLKINSFVDERLDVEKAADAAARYLLDAYKTFQDWNLAICAYNCGSGNVLKAIRRSGSKQFWDLYPYLPRETRGYVPAFVGAMYAFTYQKEYGLVKGETLLPIHADTLEINKNLHFKQISEIIGVPIEILREMNPQYRHDIVPGNEGTYILKIPFNYTGDFIDKADTIYAHKADTLLSPKVIKNIQEGGNGASITYKVKSGDNLGKIAQRYHVSVNQLRKWNHISGSMIRVGQRLTIYSNGGPAPASEKKADTTTDPDGYSVYTVKSGDSLYTIAKNFPGVSADDIMKFNGISSNIKPGMKIRIPKK